VRFARPPVRRPARVTDARRSRQRILLERGVEVRELAHGAHDLDPSPGVHREPGRVVPAILEAPKALDQNRRTLLRADVANDSAHGGSPNERALEGNPAWVGSKVTWQARARRYGAG